MQDHDRRQSYGGARKRTGAAVWRRLATVGRSEQCDGDERYCGQLHLAPGIVVSHQMVERAAAGRSAPLLLFDLAVPRDIEQRVADIPNVHLQDVDALEPICTTNRALRAAEAQRAEAIIDGEVAKFIEWWAVQQAVPTIRALRERAESIRDAEIRRALARCPELSPQQRETVVALSTAIINKLLHEPIVALRDPEAGSELVTAVRRLFNIDDTPFHALQR